MGELAIVSLLCRGRVVCALRRVRRVMSSSGWCSMMVVSQMKVYLKISLLRSPLNRVVWRLC